MRVFIVVCLLWCVSNTFALEWKEAVRKERTNKLTRDTGIEWHRKVTEMNKKERHAKRKRKS